MVLEKGRPSYPLVTYLAFECCCRPPDQGKPLSLVDRQVSDAFSYELVKPKIMVLAHKFVPSGSFFPPDGSYFNAVKTG